MRSGRNGMRLSWRLIHAYPVQRLLPFLGINHRYAKAAEGNPHSAQENSRVGIEERFSLHRSSWITLRVLSREQTSLVK